MTSPRRALAPTLGPGAAGGTIGAGPRQLASAAGPPAGGPSWPCRHGGAAGRFDETARRASHQELAVAQVLVSEGHDVRTVAERRGDRTPDLVACGTSVEVKAFQALAERQGRPPTAKGVANKLLDARGQGSVAVIWAEGSGLSLATAKAGYSLFCRQAATEGLGRARGVRIIGDGFDMTLSAAADVRAARGVAAVPRPAPQSSPRMRVT